MRPLADAFSRRRPWMELPAPPLVCLPARRPRPAFAPERAARRDGWDPHSRLIKGPSVTFTQSLPQTRGARGPSPSRQRVPRASGCERSARGRARPGAAGRLRSTRFGEPWREGPLPDFAGSVRVALALCSLSPRPLRAARRGFRGAGWRNLWREESSLRGSDQREGAGRGGRERSRPFLPGRGAAHRPLGDFRKPLPPGCPLAGQAPPPSAFRLLHPENAVPLLPPSLPRLRFTLARALLVSAD